MHLKRYLVSTGDVATVVDLHMDSEQPEGWPDIIADRIVKALPGTKRKETHWSAFYEDQVAEGVYYNWGLAGPQGAWFELLLFPWHTPEDRARAKRYLKCTQDVVTIYKVPFKYMVTVDCSSLPWAAAVDITKLQEEWEQLKKGRKWT